MVSHTQGGPEGCPSDVTPDLEVVATTDDNEADGDDCFGTVHDMQPQSAASPVHTCMRSESTTGPGRFGGDGGG